MSGDFDDFIIVSSSNKKVAADVKKALRKKLEQEYKEALAEEAGEEERTCESAKYYPKWKHENVKPRPFRYGWNGAENAYEESVDLCDDCYEAQPNGSLS